jgi:4-hydroxy-tetrahydrodipicolinate synthase
METTRRDALGLGAVAAAAAAAAITAKPGRASAQTKHRLGSATKTLLWTATVTPCDRSGKFDPGAFRDILAWNKECGVDGVVVLGTSGEFPSFSVAERRQITEAAVKNKNGLNIMVGPGTPNIAETIELSRHAQDVGADGLLVIPPFYFNEPPTDGLTRYYSMLFDAVSIPINLYHIPGTSEVPISLDLLKNLSHYPHLAGIKDSSGNKEGYAAFVAGFPELNMRTGTNSNLEHALDNGMGAILADGNVFTKLSADVFKAYHAKQDYKPALQKLRSAQQIMRSSGIFSYGAMKYALSLQMGGPQTYQRPPNPDVTDAQKAAIKAGLEQVKALG